MQNRSHAYLVRIRFAHGASGDDAILCHLGTKRVGAHDWNGNLPLIKHNCTSGRTHVSKGGVSHEVSDSYLRHSSDDSREEGVSLDPELVDCLVVYMIFDN